MSADLLRACIELLEKHAYERRLTWRQKLACFFPANKASLLNFPPICFGGRPLWSGGNKTVQSSVFVFQFDRTQSDDLRQLDVGLFSRLS